MDFLTLNDGRKELYQWDIGRIASVDIECNEVHFSNVLYGDALVVEVKNNEVAIPNQLLRIAEPIYCWAFFDEDNGGYTKKEQIFNVIKRAKPSDYVYFETEIKRIETVVKEVLQEIIESGDFKGEGDSYDHTVINDEEFSTLLYPLNGGKPNLSFSYKKILVKDVTFKIQRGSSDLDLHIFQPSIKYIKFENCRWETQWWVSGKVPSVLATGGTQYERAEGDLELVIDGIEVTADNVQDAKNAGVYWYIGLRNIKALINSTVRYPEGYDIGNGWSFKLTCQYFDYASNNKIPAFWDGANVSDCYIIEKLVRCTNCVNIVADPVLKNSVQNVVSIQNCENISNFSGFFSFSGCKNISASKEAVVEVVEYVENYTQDHFVPLRLGEGLKTGEYFLYAVTLNSDGTSRQTKVHARSEIGKNEVPLRTEYGTLLSVKEWSENNYDYSDATKWSPATLMPRDYIDRMIKKYDNAISTLQSDINGLEQRMIVINEGEQE